MASVAVISGALGSLAGCLSTARGEFASTGYTSTYGYEIPYQRGTKLLLPVEWGIDNLRLEHGQWVHKDQSNYVTKYEFDDDGDGKAENSLEIIEQGAATVGGQPAYAATFDLANIDEVKVAPRARSRRIQFVVLRAPKDEVVEATKGLSREVYPVILLAGYSNMPADFAKGLHDFHGLLRNMVFAGKSG